MDSYAAADNIPVVRFAKGDWKIEVMRPHLERAAAARTEEKLVRDRVTFRVGRLVYLGFSPDRISLGR